MITSTDAGKAFDNIQHLFMIKILNKLGLEGKYLNIIRHLEYARNAHLLIINEY